MILKELLTETLVFCKKYGWPLIILIVVIVFAFPGMTALSELASRDKELEYLQNQKVNILIEIASNLQVHAEHAEVKGELLLVSIDKNLLAKKALIDQRFSCLSDRIITGSNICKPKVEGLFSDFNSNGLLIRLLFFASLAGSFLNLLWGKGTQPVFIEIVFSLSGGVGAGIVCLLLFTSSTWMPSMLGGFSGIGSSIKILFGFIAGLYSEKLLKFLSYNVDKLIDNSKKI